MSENSKDNESVLQEIFTDGRSIEKLKHTEPREIIELLIEEHFSSETFYAFDPAVRDSIRECVKNAYIAGGMLSLYKVEVTPLQKLIAADAVEFEKTLSKDLVLARVPCSTMPWGWRYFDDAIQRQFRDYCVNNKKG